MVRGQRMLYVHPLFHCFGVRYIDVFFAHVISSTFMYRCTRIYLPWFFQTKGHVKGDTVRISFLVHYRTTVQGRKKKKTRQYIKRAALTIKNPVKISPGRIWQTFLGCCTIFIACTKRNIQIPHFSKAIKMMCVQ